MGYFAPHEGPATLAYGVYHIPSLGAHEICRARLAADRLGMQNYDFANSRRVIRSEERTYLKCASHQQATP